MDRRVETYLHEHQDRFLAELIDLLRIPSISAQPEHRPDMARAAKFLLDRFTGMGLAAEIIPTAGHPIVYAEWLGRPDAPTVLIYGHYDVQPPDPLDQWTTPPFEPTIRDGKIYARGATDDKGQFFTHLKAVEAWMRATGSLPVNVKFVIEGEEEVGSPNLPQFLEQRRENLTCSVAVISDTAQFSPGVPSIVYGLRGLMACEIVVHGPNRDVHSGVYGGLVANPANAICRIIASLHDAHGKIAVPGFYDDVCRLTDAEEIELGGLSFDASSALESLGLAVDWGEQGFTPLMRKWVRPTCDVNGLQSGYQGSGPKTIIPSRASAKLTCRLVSHQSPTKIGRLLGRHIADHAPPGVRVEVRIDHGCDPYLMPPDQPAVQFAKNALRYAFGRDPVLAREGGSIPVVVDLKRLLGVDTLLVGLGRDGDNLHSPDEHFHLSDYTRGMIVAAELLDQLAAMS